MCFKADGKMRHCIHSLHLLTAQDQHASHLLFLQTPICCPILVVLGRDSCTWPPTVVCSYWTITIRETTQASVLSVQRMTTSCEPPSHPLRWLNKERYAGGIVPRAYMQISLTQDLRRGLDGDRFV